MRDISIFSFYLLLAIIFLIPFFQPVPFSFAQEESSTIPNSIYYYGCVGTVSGYKCDLMLNEISGFSASADATQVFSATYEKDSFESGIKDKALRLNAEYRDSFVIHSDPINPMPFSISFFIKPIDPPRPVSVILSNVGVARNGWYMDMDHQNNQSTTSFKIYLDRMIVSSEKIPLVKNQFSHIVVTFDGSTITLFKNGVLFQEMEVTGVYEPSELPFRIGSASWSASSFGVSGILDELYMFSRVLTHEEILNIDNPNLLSDNDITFYFPFDGDTNDYSGNNLNASLNTLIASMAFSPDGRLFFTEKNSGNIKILQNDIINPEPFYQINDVWVGPETGLLGITIDPKFQENGFVYFYYTYRDLKSGNFYQKIIRVQDQNGIGINPVVILEKITGDGGFHAGGALAFGPDDKLYATVGDATQHEFALDPNILLGKILRINRDGTIPSDNPYPNSPVYTIGHRNMYGIAFDPNGLGLVTENGVFNFDEVNIIYKGGNYGFPLLQPANLNPYLSDKSKSIMPVLAFPGSPAPTQATYYDGNKFPDHFDRFLFGTFSGHIISLGIDNSTKLVSSYDDIMLAPKIFYPVIAIDKSPNGDIYFGAYNIYKIEKIEKREQFLFPISIVTGSSTPPFEKIAVITEEKKMVLYPILENFEREYAFKIPAEVSSKLDSVVDSQNNPINFSSFFDPDQMELNLHLFDKNNDLKNFSFAQLPDSGCILEDPEKLGKAVGRIEWANGETLFKRHGDKTWRFTPNNLQIKFGDFISTVGDDSRLRIILEESFGKRDSSPLIINMGPNSKLCIAEDSTNPFGEKKGFYDLVEGQIQILSSVKNPNGSVNVNTKTSNYELGDFNIVIYYDSLLNKKIYYLKEGIVDIVDTTDGETITLNEDQTIEISRSKIFPVSTLKNDDWNSLLEKIDGTITKIPDWVKNNARWWAEGQVTETEFVLAIQFLKDQRILVIPPVEVLEKQEQQIPEWIKNNAGWWANGQITDNDFIKGLQFLGEHGILKV